MRAKTFVSHPLALALLAMLALLGLVLLRMRPPAPLPVDAEPTRFSAGRARVLLEQLLPEAPHPVGSEANARVREGIVARLRGLGIPFEEQRELVCGDYASCAPVTNIVAKLPGRTNAPAVALVAHYDSVPAGQGAADDGSGIAILLEAARALSSGPALRRPILFLFTDGEEVGLLGARAFVDRHPLSRDIHAVVNVEARGSSGPSLLFEIRGAEAHLTERYARAAPHPVTSSLFTAVYERMPNDSDLSVFARAGIPGINLGFIGEVSHYHTPLDDLAHLDLRSLQDQGEHALAMVRALADDEVTPTAGQAVFFDVLALGVVRYPTHFSLPIALVVFLAAGVVTFSMIRKGRLPLHVTWLGLFAFVLSPAIAVVTSWGLVQALYLSGVTKNWLAYPWPCLLAFVAIGLLCATLALTLTIQALGHWAAGFVGWAFFAVVVSFVEPKVAYLFLVPALGYLVSAPALALAPKWHVTAVVLPALLAGLVFFPILALVYEAVGMMAMPVYGGAVALLGGTLLPLACDISQRAIRGAGFVLAGSILVLSVTTVLLTQASRSRPERLSLALLDDAEGQKRWLAFAESGRLPASLAEAASFGARRIWPFPWSGELAYAAEAEVPSLEPPQVEILAREDRRVRLRLKTVRPDDSLLLAFPSANAPEFVRVQSEPARLMQMGAFRVLRIFGIPTEGLDLELGTSARQCIEAFVVASSPGLPEAAHPLLDARPAWAVPSQDGDRRIVSRRLVLD